MKLSDYKTIAPVNRQNMRYFSVIGDGLEVSVLDGSEHILLNDDVAVYKNDGRNVISAIYIDSIPKHIHRVVDAHEVGN